jgi:hypothetical protein
MVGDDREERDRREPRREDEHRDAAAREGERRGGDADRRARRTWTPWLVIRYTSTDDGRGRPIPDNTVFWASPDIWVESSDPLGNPVVGEANFVHARVFNLGKAQARPTRVDMFWMEPSIGPGSMNWLGSTWVEVPYHKSKDVRCPVPWVPQFLGHECLIVHASADIDDPIALPFEPRLDRHVGQRNVNVVAAVPGQPLHYLLKVHNVAATAARVTIAVHVEHVAISRGASRTMARRDVVDQVTSYRRRAVRAQGAGAEIVHDVAADGRLARSAPQIDSKLSDDSVIVPTRDGNSHFGQMLLAADRPSRFNDVVDTRDAVTLHETRMNAFEQRRLELQLTVPATARPGEFIVAHVMQSIEGLSAGGYTIVAEMTGR